MKMWAICIAAIALCASCTGRYDVTLDTLLSEMVDRDAVTRYPSLKYKQAQASSYDRRTVSPQQQGWWANNDGGGYDRVDTVAGRCEKVLCELDGPGAVTRIWMTTKEKFGTLRIYLDGESEARIEIPAYDMKRFPLDVPEGLSLTHTHYEERMEGVGGNSFFLPIPYAKSCKITFEEPDMSVFIPRYYHIGYRSYEKGTSVKTFTLKEAAALRDKMLAVSKALLDPEACWCDTDECCRPSSQAVLRPGETLTLDLPEGTKAVKRLSITASDEEALSIGMTFDGKVTAKAPLAHFAGAGTGAPKVDGWWLSNDESGQIVCRFPMPYRSGASITLTNISDKEDVQVSVEAAIKDYDWDESSLYFHVSHRYEAGIPVSPDYDSMDNLDWNFITIKGRGVYAGDLLSLNNHAIDWYGEGDEKIWVDSDSFPSFMGTGTEDYFNCSWAPVVPFLTPFGGAPRADEESSHGLNAFLRTRNLDLIPFGEKLQFDIEMLSWHPGTVDYHATAFWYGDAEAQDNSNY